MIRLKGTYGFLFLFTLLLSISVMLSSCGSSKKASGYTKNGEKFMTDAEQIAFKSTYYDGTRKKILGNYDQALSSFRQCIALDPSNAAANYEMADIFEYYKQPDTAIRFALRAVQLEPSNTWYQELYAQCLLEKGRYKDVEEVYKGLVKDHPLVADFYYKLAAAQLQSGSLSQAAQTYQSAMEKLGFNDQVGMNIAEIYERAKDYISAEKAIQDLISHSPTVPQYYDMLGNLYDMEGKSDKAFEVYQKMEQTSPEDPMVHLSLADYYREKHDSKMAFEELQKAFEQPSMDIDTKMRILITNFYSLSSGADSIAKQAMVLCDIMVRVDPQESKAHSLYGDFLFRARDFSKAHDQYRDAINADSSKYTTWEKLMRLDEQLNDYPSLVNDSRRAMDLFPTYFFPYLENGNANYLLKNYSTAVNSLQQGMGYVVDDTAVMEAFLAVLGDASNAIKQYHTSDSAYEQALKLNPNNDGVLNNYSYYLSLRDTNLDRAANMSKKSNTLVPNNGTYEDTYAWILFKQGKYADAKDWENKSLQHGGAKDNAVLDHYGDIMFKLGDKDQALQYWQKAKDGGLKSDLLDRKIRDKQLYDK